MKVIIQKEFTKKEVKKKQLIILLSVIIFLIFGYIAGNLRWIQDFQILTDLFSGTFAFFIGLLSLVRFYTKKNSLNYLLLGFGFLTVSMIEVLQILLTFNVFSDLFTIQSSEIFPNRVVLSRVFLSFIFFLSWLFMKEEYRERVVKEKIAFFGLFMISSIFVLLLSVYSQLFINLESYIFAIVMQTIALMVYILTIFGYIRSRGLYFKSFDFWLIFSIAFSIVSQIFFLPYLNIEYELMLNLSTLAKFFSYAILLIGFLHSIYEMYKSEEETQKELIKKNMILTETKKKVEEAYMILREEKWELSKKQKSADKIFKDILKN
jgi:hypothetical protein